MASAEQPPLSSAPWEVRYLIYQSLLGSETHLFMHKGQLNLMPCQGPDDVSWRRPRSDTEFWDPRWIRRVNSSWGCHWKCEEAFLDGVEGVRQVAHTPLLPLLLSSKAMFSDVIGFLSQSTQCIHLTDLETTDHILSSAISDKCSSSPITVTSQGSKQRSYFRSISSISLTLRLSIRMLSTLYVPCWSKPSFYPWLETPPVHPPRPFATVDGSGCRLAHEQWMRIWPALLKLPCLQRFSLWLDHDDGYHWAAVGERDVLQNLSDIMPALKSRNTQVVVNLPVVHLDEEPYSDDEYFIHKLPEFELQRRVRFPLAKCRIWSTNRKHDYEVHWVYNEDNGDMPSGFPRNQKKMALIDMGLFLAMGYDIYSPEWDNHPILGEI